MSHLHERKEKICLNCGANLIGRYCQDCGQENIEPKESLWHLIVHFFNDLTHFDGKFFRTVRLLFTRPGLVSLEYKNGRRTSYLHPVRLYIFTSAVFFLIFLGVLNIDYADGYQSSAAKKYVDSLIVADQYVNKDFGIYLSHVPETNEPFMLLKMRRKYKMDKAEYDSLQRSLPSKLKDNFAERYFTKTMRGVYHYFREHPGTFAQRFFDKWLHSLSKVFFFSLPLFAFFLYLLYIRKRKEYYYTSHLIFSMHYYCVLFFLILCVIFFAVYIDAGNFLGYSFLIVSFLYLFVGMQRFYQQFWLATFLKAVVQFVLLIFILGFFAFSFALISMASSAH